MKNCRIYFGNHTIANSSSFRIYDASIDMDSGTVNCLITRNDIQWGAGNGIIVKGTGNRIDNNHIGNFNYVGSYATPVWFVGNGNKLTRNEIFNGGRDTINGGDNGGEVGYNDVHHSNLINVAAADAGDWIRFTQTITRDSAADQFTCTVSAFNVTDQVNLGTAAAWQQSTADGSWGGSMAASFRVHQNAQATALQIDRWTVSTTVAGP